MGFWGFGAEDIRGIRSISRINAGTGVPRPRCARPPRGPGALGLGSGGAAGTRVAALAPPRPTSGTVRPRLACPDRFMLRLRRASGLALPYLTTGALRQLRAHAWHVPPSSPQWLHTRNSAHARVAAPRGPLRGLAAAAPSSCNPALMRIKMHANKGSRKPALGSPD